MPINFEKLLPYLITGGTAVASSILGSRATSRATGVLAEGGEKAAELTAQTAREQLDLLRQIYNLDVGLQWPAYRAGTAALGQLSKGMGTGLPASTFATPAQAPQLPTPTGVRRPGVEPAPAGGLEATFLDADANLRPEGTIKPAINRGLAGAGVGTVAGTLAGGALVGTGTGMIAGLPAGPLGMAVGAGVGALSSLIGRGRKEADKIVPYQNALTSEIGNIIEGIKRKGETGTLTQQDWQQAIDTVTGLKEKFLGMTNDFGRAGPGARQSRAWAEPMLEEGGGYASGPPVARAFGGPVMRGIRRPQPQYLVGEVGPELYDRNPPGPPYSIVGGDGPEIFNPPADGNIIPNDRVGNVLARRMGGKVKAQDKVHKVMSEFARGTLRSRSGQKVTSRAQAIAIAMSEAGLSRMAGGEVRGIRRPYLIPRAEGGDVYTNPFASLYSAGFGGVAAQNITAAADSPQLPPGLAPLPPNITTTAPGMNASSLEQQTYLSKMVPGTTPDSFATPAPDVLGNQQRIALLNYPSIGRTGGGDPLLDIGNGLHMNARNGQIYKADGSPLLAGTYSLFNPGSAAGQTAPEPNPATTATTPAAVSTLPKTIQATLLPGGLPNPNGGVSIKPGTLTPIQQAAYDKWAKTGDLTDWNALAGADLNQKPAASVTFATMTNAAKDAQLRQC